MAVPRFANTTNVRPMLFVARLAMASLAAFGGLEKIFKYSDATHFAQAFSIPAAGLLMPLAIILELGCAAALLTNRFCRPAAAILAVWTFVLGIWFHRFWSVPDQDWQMMIDSFFHHFVMAGGFVYVAVFGAGERQGGAEPLS